MQENNFVPVERRQWGDLLAVWGDLPAPFCPSDQKTRGSVKESANFLLTKSSRNWASSYHFYEHFAPSKQTGTELLRVNVGRRTEMKLKKEILKQHSDTNVTHSTPVQVKSRVKTMAVPLMGRSFLQIVLRLNNTAANWKMETKEPHDDGRCQSVHHGRALN